MHKINLKSKNIDNHPFAETSYFTTNHGFYIVEDSEIPRVMFFSHYSIAHYSIDVSTYKTVEDYCNCYGGKLLRVWNKHDDFEICFNERGYEDG